MVQCREKEGRIEEDEEDEEEEEEEEEKDERRELTEENQSEGVPRRGLSERSPPGHHLVRWFLSLSLLLLLLWLLLL